MKDETAKACRIGPEVKDWPNDGPKGGCPDCGGQCSPECGTHPLGCVFGGFTEETSYLIIADGCELFHGEPE